MKCKQIWVVFAAVLMLFIAREPLVAVQGAQPPSSTNIFFILDASGSMWGQVEGKAKIVIAKEVMSGLVLELPDDTVVGLVVYGHRHKGDCDDVQELIALGPVNKDGMISVIQGLNAIGKTPISRSVRLTAERIRHLENQTTIILVSDGKETCDPDPCALVRELKASGINFVMHVIGFDVTREEREQLECIAQAGGGQYYMASNAREFLTAAQELVKKSTPPYGILKVMVTKNGKPFFTGITLTHQESGHRWTPASSSRDTGIAEIRLTPGTYHAEIKDTGVSGGLAPVVHLRNIAIAEGETVERTADFSEGSIHLTTLRNGEPKKASVFYYREGETKPFHNESTHPKTGVIERKLLPGRYTIKVTDGEIAGKPTVIFDGLEIPSGVTLERKAEFAAGELTITATLDGKAVSIPVEITDDQGAVIFQNWTNWPRNGTRVVLLPQGSYTVVIKNTKQNSKDVRFENIGIVPGQAQTVVAEFTTGP
ncbi:vWA domain-containing protein [Desulfofustis glycolicus]|uniref:von Willebrand factor type A domain-containing protein n=1 Tax=Desulfofustis glycolicus DSM 9705 TaxID=1121409 RepID=A0A1M5XSY8_9BACT|nr:VWA domain-containing protein [Desulfofustis glycolicus]MCB2217842.1 VWA domain-containing protein [Desulfobulbaceae bacterium]SHI02373.1 von Willebrand factor type A domain-containing protein [Desulfofustis glycolicus DSM 9705]